MIRYYRFLPIQMFVAAMVTMMLLGSSQQQQVEAHGSGRHRSYGWGTSSSSSSSPCGRGHCFSNPRRYQYRRPRDRMDLLVSDILSIPVYNSNSLLRQLQNGLAGARPTYSITNNAENESIELTMEVPGVSAKDLNVQVENSNLLRIQGSRIVREPQQGILESTDFDQVFELDSDIYIERIQVKLSRGILTIIAPKKTKVVTHLTVIEEDNNNDKEEEIEDDMPKKLVKRKKDIETTKNENSDNKEDTAKDDSGLTITEDNDNDDNDNGFDGSTM